MRPTRRGYAALAVVAGAFLFAWAGDPDRARALNAIAAPVLAAVVAGAVTVYRAGKPAVDRSEPTHGFPGDARTVELAVDGGGVATITDCIGEGLSGSATFDRSLPATVEYEVTYDQRGVHRLGRTIVQVRDVLGLVETTHRINETTSVLVYPRVYAVGDPGSFLRTLGPESDERTEFDRLREYVPGDSLRDVHWKSSAKRDDMLVMEFSEPSQTGTVTIAADAAEGYADEMAAATATLAIGTLDLGLDVAVTVPDDTLLAGRGERHREHLLRVLASTGAGSLPDQEHTEADISLRADSEGTTVRVSDREQAVESLVRANSSPAVGGVP